MKENPKFVDLLMSTLKKIEKDKFNDYSKKISNSILSRFNKGYIIYFLHKLFFFLEIILMKPEQLINYLPIIYSIILDKLINPIVKFFLLK